MSTQISNIVGSLPVSSYKREADLIRKVLPFSSATLWRMVKAGTFPRPVKLGERITAWAVEDIRAWMLERAEGANHG
ncbi:MAG: AlpA family phage regulatory protein [Methylotenera sp.]|nr:AlpA family phage regulatory protein [Methylotenera sp.]MDP2404583.1 AlpA family phage regulatory protein [Methylotenera sp.]MDP3094373.1 AlpA family phage regulatory protein [Methylotenera sp.]MDZ4222195.1 AlpA family phage regulatory protein [Methylotenera sp.]